MTTSAFDEHASAYDAWFLENRTVLANEVALIARMLAGAGRVLSVGCGSGLFELLLRRDHGIAVDFGIEPSEAMAEIARKRGMQVRIGTAEESEYGSEEYDTVLFNGSPSYIGDLEAAFRKAHRALRPGGAVVVADVPKESSYAMLYMLGAQLGGWSHERVEGIQPARVYPVEFARGARWRTTREKAALLLKIGFERLTYAQTLTHHPLYSNDELEEPVEGYTRGDYVAIRAEKARG
jgi:SAM-dependent methyltransferase